MSVPADKLAPQRVAPMHYDAFGEPVFTWTLTPKHLTDPVVLLLPPEEVLPVIFVPGIMGSNLCSTARDANGEPVWRLDMAGEAESSWTLFPKSLLKKVFHDAGTRQKQLHPQRVKVDDQGDVPKRLVGTASTQDAYRQRGWGEVGEGSYHAFLLWLEDALNGQGFNPALWKQFSFPAVSATPPPGQTAAKPRLPRGVRMTMRDLPTTVERGEVPEPILSDELLTRALFRMPVHAFGYNWLDSNETSAVKLAQRIDDVIRKSHCRQVLLVTHSMGGLVARRCQQLPGMADKIAGVVHGVMPAEGAPVAYRRCKLGMADEGSGMAKLTALVIGNNGRETTAVFAQAPGALQLLPTTRYRGQWLKICDESGRVLTPQPANNVHTDIYLRRDRWWGLIREEWLSPEGGVKIDWTDYSKNMRETIKFHELIKNSYHPHTYVYYGADEQQRSFDSVTWKIRKPQHAWSQAMSAGVTEEAVASMGFHEVLDDGSNPAQVGGKIDYAHIGAYASTPTRTPIQWHLYCEKQDGAGDGTVPESSGAAPLRSDRQGHIRQQFRLTGFDHEGSYKHPGAQLVTLYSIVKIAAQAKRGAAA